MERPKVSIITINYNNLEGLKRTVRSVLNQSYSDFEYLIVDGDSTDGSKEFVQENTESLSFWISEPDSGIFNAMNKGIMNSRGDYLLFLNSGDEFTSEEALSDFVGHPNFGGDIVYGDYSFDNGGKQYPDELTPFYFMRTSLPHQSTLFNRTVFDEMGGYDERYKISSDRAFYLKCFLSENYQFQHLPVALSRFDLSGLSNSSEWKEQKVREDQQIFKDLYGIYYSDLADFYQTQQALHATRRQTAKGFWKRLVKRLKRML